MKRSRLRRPWAMLLLLGCTISCRSSQPEEVRFQQDVVYARKDGVALTMDVFFPKRPNGGAVLYVQSGGWKSEWNPPEETIERSLFLKPFLAAGYTFMVVRHGNPPAYTIPDMFEDLKDCVRFTKLRAPELGISPDRIGVVGMSAGGHLALMLATVPEPARPHSSKPRLRQSTTVAAVVAVNAPTDLRYWLGTDTYLGDVLAKAAPSFATVPGQVEAFSPILHVNPNTPPVLIVHGTADQVVSVQQARSMTTALYEQSVISKTIYLDDVDHSLDDRSVSEIVTASVGWFDKYLVELK